MIYVGTGSCGLAAGAAEVLGAIQAYLAREKSKADRGGGLHRSLLSRAPGRYPAAGEAAHQLLQCHRGDVNRLLDSFPRQARVLQARLVGAFGEEPLDGVPAFFDHPMLKPQVRVVLRNCGIIDPEEIDHYLARDGYQALETACP